MVTLSMPESFNRHQIPDFNHLLSPESVDVVSYFICWIEFGITFIRIIDWSILKTNLEAVQTWMNLDLDCVNI